MDINAIYSIVIGILGIILLLYLLLEFHYFVRTVATLFMAQMLGERVDILEETKIFGE